MNLFGKLCSRNSEIKIILDEEGNVVIEESELLIICWKYCRKYIVENLDIKRPCH